VQYDKLVETFGAEKIADYINRLDSHLASTGKWLRCHYATIKKWIAEDSRWQKPPVPAGRHPAPGKSRFANFTQRKPGDIDYIDLNKLERLMLRRGNGPFPENGKKGSGYVQRGRAPHTGFAGGFLGNHEFI
jgi:hypothetical protein